MIKPVFDCHTVCFQCRGFDCDLDNCCNECLEWSQEEMKAYIKHCKLLLRKDKRGKDSLPKPPSSPGPSPLPSQPLILTASNFDSRINNQIAELSLSFDQKLESLTNVLLSKISLLQPSVQSRCQLGCLNISSAAPPVVPVRCPSSGLDTPPLKPEHTVGFHQEYLGDGDGWVPSGSRISFPLVQGTDYDRGVRSALAADAQVPLAFAEAPAPVQVSAASASAGAPVPLAVAEAPAFVHGSVSAVSASVQVPSAVAEAPSQVACACDHLLCGPPVASSSTAEQAEEEEDDAALVVSNPPVMNKALARLAAFIHDEYPKSCPLSAPPLQF